jgi:excisionase family DNA binding protein
MMNQTGGILSGQATPGVQGPAASAAAQTATVAPELFTPGQVAQMLGVTESDVMVSLQKGDLKGKQIGTQWRVTRAAVDQFLHS